MATKKVINNILVLLCLWWMVFGLSEVNGRIFHKRQTEELPPELDVSIGTQCVFDGRVFKSGTSIKDGCNNCRCNNGLVACAYSTITEEGCLYLESKESTTSPPNGCKFEGQYRYDGEVFVAADECNKCWCNKGEIICPFEDDCENIVARRRSLNAE